MAVNRKRVAPKPTPKKAQRASKAPVVFHPRLFEIATYPLQYQRHDPAYVGEIRGIYGARWRPSDSLFGGRGGKHKGVDIYAWEGCPVVAVVDGDVEFIKDNEPKDDLGNRAWLWFVGPDGKKWRFLYGHLQRFEGAARSVKRGSVIGYVGCSGNADYDHVCSGDNQCGMRSTHCHLALRDAKDIPIDPLPFLAWRLRYASDLRDIHCSELRAASAPQSRSIFERQQLIVEQLLHLERFADRPETERWRRFLLQQLEEGARLADYPDNVDITASDEARATAMVAILEKVVAATDADADGATRLNVRNFLLHVAWHEGARLKRRTQMSGGPARSFFQLEAPRAKDAVEYAKVKKFLDDACDAAGVSVADIEKAAKALQSGVSAFPAGNLLGDRLGDADAFAAWLVRCVLMRISDPIPIGNTEHAAYWYTHWKVTGGDEAALKRVFARAADEVDTLLP